MKNQGYNSTTIFLKILLILLFVVFFLFVFKNISYPLIWNDESESVMVGDRILEYGYPKVHDGKNAIFMSYAPDIKDENGKLVGYKEKYDAYIYMTWGNYYWAAIGVYLAKFTDDIYTKTALLRIPFAIMGLLGLLLFASTAKKFFLNHKHRIIFLILFVFFELFSISLILHMREARYFSLVIFLCACFFYIYSEYFLFKKWSDTKYYISMILLLFFSFHINFISFAIFSAALAFNRGVVFLYNISRSPQKFRNEFFSVLKSSIPIIISIILIYPFLIFFELYKTSTIISQYLGFTFDSYKTNLWLIYEYLTNLEFANIFLLVKAIWLVLWFYIPSAKKRKSEVIDSLQKFSLFATAFFIIYILVISRTPYLYVRHYIVLQPIMVIIMIIDAFLLFYYYRLLQKDIVSKALFAYLMFLPIIFTLNAINKIKYIRGHIYEITHQYKGVLDYVIPYIQQNFKNPENLVIATNYEGFSYIYYLKSKVTIGFIDHELEGKYNPDIIIYRKYWRGDESKYIKFMQKEKYRKISFPVADYPLNNIPELDYEIKHLFETKLASNEQEQTDIYIKTN